MNANVKSIRLPRLSITVNVPVGADPFETSCTWLLAVEGPGGDAQDPGGPTNYGWTLSTLVALGPALADFDGDGDVDLADLRALTPSRAESLYRPVFWDKLACGQLPAQVACALFDAGVNMGKPRGVRFLQQAFNDLPGGLRGRSGVAGLSPDGIIGPQTLSAITALCTLPGATEMLLGCMLSRRRSYYAALRDIASAQIRGKTVPWPYRRYYDGWMHRVQDLTHFISQAF